MYRRRRKSEILAATTYLQNDGKLEIAQQMASPESARATSLYDRCNEAVALGR